MIYLQGHAQTARRCYTRHDALWQAMQEEAPSALVAALGEEEGAADDVLRGSGAGSARVLTRGRPRVPRHARGAAAGRMAARLLQSELHLASCCVALSAGRSCLVGVAVGMAAPHTRQSRHQVTVEASPMARPIASAEPEVMGPKLFCNLSFF